MLGQQARYKRVLELEAQLQNIRNVSIIAHVDHGKTTLADCLIASNNLIHRRQAGHLKILDSRLDQIDRGITMKSSSIALLYQQYLINLIDSPGHSQFSLEVSSALRLTDSALLLVDVVQGVSSQTFRVIKQLYEQRLPGVLVLNKVDKLIDMLQMDPSQIYLQLSQIIERVNAVFGSFILQEAAAAQNISNFDKQKLIQQLQNKFFFSAEKQNIIFGSALDGWGFSLYEFTNIISLKLGLSQQTIIKHIWGQHYFDPKTKSFRTEPRNDKDKPLCVNFILKPICDIFQCCRDQNMTKLANIIKFLGLKTDINDSKNRRLNKQIMSQWLPLDLTLFQTIAKVCPNPIQAQKFRLSHLLKGNIDQKHPLCKAALECCSNSTDVPFIAFIARMLSVTDKNVNQHGLQPMEWGQQIKLVGLARVYSGKLKRKSKVFCIPVEKKRQNIQKQQHAIEKQQHPIQITINNLYYLNAQNIQGVQEVYAGNVIAVGGVEEYVYKSATLCSIPECPSIAPIAEQVNSILKVSVTTPSAEDMPKLVSGLKKLNMSDPSVDVYIEARGDIILSTCGQVHLEKCIFDLQKIFCKVPIKISDPIISFRQTIIWNSVTQNNHQSYIEEQQRKKKQKMLKLRKEQFQAEKRQNSVLSQLQQVKKKAIQQWDQVEIYQTEDLTAQDIRFFFKNRTDPQAQQRAKALQKRQKVLQAKKFDHKNKGKVNSKSAFLNLSLKANVANEKTPNQLLNIRIKAVGIDISIVDYLERNYKQFQRLFGKQDIINDSDLDRILTQRVKFIDKLFQKLVQARTEQSLINLIEKKMVGFGPNRCGSNLFIMSSLNQQQSFVRKVRNLNADLTPNGIDLNQKVLGLLNVYKLSQKQFVNAVIAGFNLACTSGPLCNEPMVGVVFILQDAIFQQPEQLKPSEKKAEGVLSIIEEFPRIYKQSLQQLKDTQDIFGPFSGQVISAVKACCIQAFIGASPRLVQPLYICELQTNERYYGEVYKELSLRRATIISEQVQQISNMFVIKALMPALQVKNNLQYKQMQSTHFCLQLMDRTQGIVSAQLGLDTWKIFSDDPFYTPLTQEEIEQEGVGNFIHNPARILLEKIRAKKGLPAIQKIVTAAEKQSTLKRK